ncbi:MAG: hypothetical protein B6D56_01365 [Candidatus Omnitrophica bacterium 4484_70.1]|nr:MAG: hypothetical protein B6D56_01365 [Candidatus Omnitrophica bacterium 4484_70.1]
MKDFYSRYTNDDLWLIKEIGFSRELQGVREAQMALGNGYLGMRGIYEEIPYNCKPGTYIAGIYDKMSAQVSEIVNFPNPVNFKFTIEGEKLGVVAMDIVEHRRILNLKKALLVRHTVFKDTKGRLYDYQSLRFVSYRNKNIGVMQIVLTPLSSEGVFDVCTGIDTSVANSGVLTEGRKRHFRVRELGQEKKCGYLVVETLEKKYNIVYWAGFYYRLGRKRIVAKDNIFHLRLKKNQSVVFTKIFCIKHFPYKEDHTAQKEITFNIFSKAFRSDFNSLIEEHIEGWKKLWKKADIIIEEAEADVQQNIRFNIYHLLICAPCDNGFSSIGARTLSGEGYRGHVFWDTEIFVFPFYLYNFPQIARNILLYRCRRLAVAREIARRNGYEGAQFAWESASTGEEETPEWAKDIDHTITKIYTHKMEHHITADIAYAIYRYYLATEDRKFMKEWGYEVIFEIARFWASRVSYNKYKKKYEINHVIGPDEFHIDVNNNAFTNMMAKWSLIVAAKLWQEVKKEKSLCKKLNLRREEVTQWKQIAAKIAINISRRNVIEQFDGYFKLKRITLNKTDEHGLPLIPSSIKAKDLGKTQLVKQADVVMLLCLLSDVFHKRTKEANYNFYLPRTVHKSSLSAAIYACMACEVRDLHRAYNFFNIALRTDISNLYGNTHQGIHVASIGGSWQAIIFGFAGVKIKRGKLFITPYMPHRWKKIVFNFLWKKCPIKLEVTNEVIKIKISSSQIKSMEVGIFDKVISVKTNRVYTFKRSDLVTKKESYY